MINGPAPVCYLRVPTCPDLGREVHASVRTRAIAVSSTAVIVHPTGTFTLRHSRFIASVCRL